MKTLRDTPSTLRPFAFLLILATLATQAADSPPAPVKPRSSGAKPEAAGSRIVDGTNVPASQFPTVGEVGDASGVSCTGTLISPRHVLTAGHCVADGNGQLSWGKTAGRFILGGQTYPTVDIIVHPSYDGNDEVEGSLDLAILVLDRPVPGVTPTPLNRVAPAVGQVLTLAGYGVTGNGTTGVNDNSPVPAPGTIDFGTTPIDIVTATFVKWNFDNQPPPNKESNTAPGDSGGPAFLTQNGQLVLAAVTSGGTSADAAFGDLSYDTRVDIAAAWIDSITGTSSTPSVSIAASAPTGSEIGPEAGAFQVTRTGDLAQAITINFTVGGTATSGADYAPIGTSVSIAAGAASATIAVTPVLDASTEGAETVIVTIAKPPSLELGTAAATVRIIDTPLVKLTSGPAANPNPAAARSVVTFTAAANLSDASFAWNFGDGSTGAGASVTHTYTAGGTYSVSVTASDAGKDSSDTKSLSLVVSGFRKVVDARISRSRFTVNFSRPDSSRLDFKVSSPDFVYTDRFEFEDAVDGTEVEVFIGATRIDNLEIFRTRGFGDGTLTWNMRKGEITYRLRASDLVDLLRDFGARDDDTQETLKIPLFVLINDVAYGSEFTYSYKAKAGRTGLGK